MPEAATEPPAEDRRTRTVRNLVEPVAGVAFFAVEVHDRYEALGFANPGDERDGIRAFDWTAYFAARAACLARPGDRMVDGRVAAAAFGVFPEARVAAALDDAYAMTTPATLLAARLEGTVLALRRLLTIPPSATSRVAEGTDQTDGGHGVNIADSTADPSDRTDNPAGPADPADGAEGGDSTADPSNRTDSTAGPADPADSTDGPADRADGAEGGDSTGGVGGVGGDAVADPGWGERGGEAARPWRGGAGEKALAFAIGVLDRGLAAAPTAGSPLFAGLRELPEPASLLGRWWRLCDQYREQRMDVHVAAMTAAGLDGCQACILNDARQGLGIGTYVRTRGWSTEEIDTAAAALRDRGLIDDGALTDQGREFREALEAATDAGQTPILDAIGDDLEPFAAAAGWQRQAIIDGYGYPGRRFVESTARRRG